MPKMFKCFDKFCSNPELKTEEDTWNCVDTRLANKPDWKPGMCFYQRDGAGCAECGGRTIKGSACAHCIVCGWSMGG